MCLVFFFTLLRICSVRSKGAEHKHIGKMLDSKDEKSQDLNAEVSTKRSCERDENLPITISTSNAISISAPSLVNNSVCAQFRSTVTVN